MTIDSMTKSIESILQNLERFLERDNFKGYDPYDGLNSPFLKFLTFKKKWLRIAVMQFMRRFPINLRHLFGIAKGRNPKAMGLLASAYIELYKQTKDENYLKKVGEILEWLVQNRSQGYSGSAWGYNFDWQSAIFYIPKGGPTVVNTAFISNAFLDAYEVLKEERYLEIARSSCDFILKDLDRSYLKDIRSSDPEIQNSSASSEIRHSQTGKSETPFCFSYSTSDSTCTHNANLLAVELLTRVHYYTKEKVLLENASMALRFTLSHFNSNGSIYQGVTRAQKFIDSFHTGFILVSLKNISNSLDFADDGGFKPRALSLQGRQSLEKGYEYYKNTFWEDDRCPRYYHSKKYPIDLHCSAQGIITFLEFREYDNEAVDMAKQIANWAIENMWDDKNGYFYFQKMKLYTNKIPYIRWPNAWMFLALTRLANIL